MIRYVNVNIVGLCSLVRNHLQYFEDGKLRMGIILLEFSSMSESMSFTQALAADHHHHHPRSK